MINRQQVETILKINGLEPTSPDEEIRSLLLSASFNDDEIDTAITILRQNKKKNYNRVDGLHKVFRTNEGLSPHEVSNLLGVDVNFQGSFGRAPKNKNLSKTQYAIVTLISIICAVLVVLAFMYVYEVGVFHPGMNNVL